MSAGPSNTSSYFSCPPPPKTTSTLTDAVFVHVHHELGPEEGEKSKVVLHRSNERFSSPIALRIHPSSKGSERVILSATRWRLHSHPRISNQKPFNMTFVVKRWLKKGTGRLSEKRRPRVCQGAVGTCIRIQGCTGGDIGLTLG